MKIARPLLSFVLFLQAVIALYGQITAASSQSDHGEFPIRFGNQPGQPGGAAVASPPAARTIGAAVAVFSIPVFKSFVMS